MNFPLQVRFKRLAISSQIYLTDAAGNLVFYVKQKAFKLKEAITVFADEEQTRPLYRIAADRVLDFSARYHITREDGTPVATIGRKGMRSIWKAHYDLSIAGGPELVIREENAWVKVIDGIVGDIPIVGLFTGYMFHPAYRVTSPDEATLHLRVQKQPALFEGRYTIERPGSELTEEQQTAAVLGIQVLLLLERTRG